MAFPIHNRDLSSSKTQKYVPLALLLGLFPNNNIRS